MLRLQRLMLSGRVCVEEMCQELCQLQPSVGQNASECFAMYSIQCRTLGDLKNPAKLSKNLSISRSRM